MDKKMEDFLRREVYSDIDEPFELEVVGDKYRGRQICISYPHRGNALNSREYTPTREINGWPGMPGRLPE